MREEPFKYDVAFSFLKKDEELACRINDLLRDRVETFFSPRKGQVIAGADDEKTYNEILACQARIVVLLYGEDWGKTPETRIEESVLRDRAHEEGYDFILAIPLETPSSIPKWLPKRQMWRGLDRWGIEGAASVIEARVQQAGGTPFEGTPLERAQRIERETASEESRRMFLCSEQGVISAETELLKVFDEIERVSKENGERTPKMVPRTGRNETHFVMSMRSFSLELDWFLQRSKTLEDSFLHVIVWKGVISISGVGFEKPRALEKVKFVFDRSPGGEFGWRRSKGNTTFLSSRELAEECVRILLDEIRAELLRD
jgi:hypothetical protein